MADAPNGDHPSGLLDVAVRAFAIRARQDAESGAPREEPRVPRQFLVFDTETSVDPPQRLIFGSFRYLEVDERCPDFRLVCLQEALFHADDLGKWYPDALQVLRDYVEPQPLADVVKDRLTSPRRVRLMTQTEFLERVLWRVVNNIRGSVVCFNSPFDLSRLAWKAGYARDRSESRNDALAGGFAFGLWRQPGTGKSKASHYRRALAIKPIDSKRSLKGLRSARYTDWIDKLEEGGGGKSLERPYRGEFLDLRTLAFALTDNGHTLESACDAFGVSYTKREGVKHGILTPDYIDYIDYCFEDTEATAQLLEATVREFLRHPIDLPATRAYSPATIGKSYLRAMGVKPPLARQDFDPKLLGWSMSAYYGGRAECRIRRAGSRSSTATSCRCIRPSAA